VQSVLEFFFAPLRELFLLLLRARAPRGFADVVLGFGDAHDPLIEPTNDVLQALDAVPGLT
jgi:hypothetical protein